MMESSPLTNDELRLLTWSSSENMTIDSEVLRKNCPLDNDRLLPPTLNAKSTAPVSSISTLEALPLEIIHLILNELDLQTLTDCRALSRRIRSLIDNYPPYHTIVEHHPDSLRALPSTHMAAYFTARDIFEALCSQACFHCGQFGQFLDMFTGHRQCFLCIAHSAHLWTIRVSLAKTIFGLKAKTIRELPTLLSVPGKYGERHKSITK